LEKLSESLENLRRKVNKANEKKPVIDHIRELRSRILISIFIFLICFIVTFPLAPFIINFLRESCLSGIPLYSFSPHESLFLYLEVSMITALILSFPIWFYHFFSFIRPALTPKETRYVLGLAFISLLLFILGVAFSYFIILRVTLSILLQLTYLSSTPLFNLQKTIEFILLFLFFSGLSFQLPLVLYALLKLGIISKEKLIGLRKYFWVLAFFIGAIITPDASGITQIMVAIPLISLYEITLLIIRLKREN